MDKHKLKQVLIIAAVAGMLVLAGCSDTGSGDTEKMEEKTGKDVSNTNVGDTYAFESKLTEKNQQQLVKGENYPEMKNSLERQNLARRYEYLNDQNNQHYIYLMSHGKVVAEYIAQGKVSSVNSKLTNDKQIVAREDCLETTANGDEAACFKTVESPQLDGSYGENGDAIFFFTSDGRYVEWNGEYLVSEQPLDVETPVLRIAAEGNNSEDQ